MDSDKSVYFQTSKTNSMRQLKKQLSLSKTTKDNETSAKKVKLENISTNNTMQSIQKITNATEQQNKSSLEVGLERLKDDFFNVSCEQLAKNLLGKILVRNSGDSVLKGRIVETECYPGGEDKASHSFNGKITPRNKPMFMKPGTCYVYLTYGMYHCFNISCQGDGAAVLIRALEPLESIDKMMENRLNFQGRKNKPTKAREEKQIQSRDLCNGPGKLTVAFAIDMQVNEKDICSWQGLYIGRSHGEVVDPERIVASQRIGIDSHGEPWTGRLWRFYIYGNRCVSKFDRLREKEMQRIADQT